MLLLDLGGLEHSSRFTKQTYEKAMSCTVNNVSVKNNVYDLTGHVPVWSSRSIFRKVPMGASGFALSSKKFKSRDEG